MEIFTWCAPMDMVRIARASRALKTLACAPESWHVLQLHEGEGLKALRFLTTTFPDALRSTCEICVDVLRHSEFNGLGAFLNHACAPCISNASNTRDSASHPVSPDNGCERALVQRDEAKNLPSPSTATASHLELDACRIGEETGAIGTRLPNRRLQRLYLIDADMCAPELVTLGTLFPNLEDLVIVEHGVGVSQMYDVGEILTRLLWVQPHLQSLVVRFAGKSPLEPVRAVGATLRIPPTLARLSVSAWRHRSRATARVGHRCRWARPPARRSSASLRVQDAD
jgi:hypothetical protein